MEDLSMSRNMMTITQTYSNNFTSSTFSFSSFPFILFSYQFQITFTLFFLIPTLIINLFIPDILQGFLITRISSTLFLIFPSLSTVFTFNMSSSSMSIDMFTLSVTFIFCTHAQAVECYLCLRFFSKARRPLLKNIFYLRILICGSQQR